MGFVIQWLWCLLAFAVGSAIAWLITVVAIRRTSEEQAVAEMPDAGEIGAR